MSRSSSQEVGTLMIKFSVGEELERKVVVVRVSTFMMMMVLESDLLLRTR